MTHVWRLKKYLPHRHGQRCRVLVESRGAGPRNIMVQFADGVRVVTSRWAVRPWTPGTVAQADLFGGGQ